MFRQEYKYSVMMKRFNKALIGIGVYSKHNYRASDLIGNLKIEGLEELMLAAYVLMKHLREYLSHINVDVEEGYKIIDLYAAIGEVLKYTYPVDCTDQYYISHEANAMEQISRSAYAWLKSFRMLKNQKHLKAFAWDDN